LVSSSTLANSKIRPLALAKFFASSIVALSFMTIFSTGLVDTNDKIVVFGDGNDRYDIPKSEIKMAGRNVLIGLNVYEIARKYKVSRE
jgi:hypothetical protein